MNAYYTNGNSVKKINTSSLPKINVKSGFIEFVCSLIAFFTCKTVVNIFKATTMILCLGIFFGIVGGMDSGSIGMFKGFICCAMCSFIEIIILKSMTKQEKASEDHE